MFADLAKKSMTIQFKSTVEINKDGIYRFIK